jgi:quinol monooxygenase YgiN
MPTQLNILAILTAAPGAEAKLRAAQEILVADTLREAGCIRYELNQSLDDGRVVVFIETWASEAAWQAHMEGAAIARFRAGGAGELVADMRILRLTPVAGGFAADAA